MPRVSRSLPILPAAVFIANFGIAKAIAFGGPLLLAFHLDPVTYGALELALAWGLLASLVLSAGLPSAYPQLTLRRRPIPFRDVLGTLLAVTMFGLVAAAIVAATAGAHEVVVLALLVTALSAFQGTSSVLTQTHSRRNLAAWSTSFATNAVVVVALVCAWAGAMSWLTVALGAVAVVFAAAAARDAWLSQQEGMWRRLATALPVALPLFAAAGVSVWIGNSSRVLLGLTVSLADVAMFAVLFRVAAVTLLFHQLLSLGLFARIYTAGMRMFDRYASLYLAGLAVVFGAMVLAFPSAIGAFRPTSIPLERVPDAVTLFPIVALLVFGWLVGGALEGRVGRARRAGRLAVWSAGIAGATIAAIGALAWLGAGLGPLIVALMLQSLALPGAMLIILRRRGAKLWRTTLALALGTMLLGALAIWMLAT